MNRLRQTLAAVLVSAAVFAVSSCGGGSDDVVVSQGGAAVTVPTSGERITLTHSDGTRETAPVADIVDEIPSETITQFCEGYARAEQERGGKLSVLDLTKLSVGFANRYDMTGGDALTLVTELRSRC